MKVSDNHDIVSITRLILVLASSKIYPVFHVSLLKQAVETQITTDDLTT